MGLGFRVLGFRGFRVLGSWVLGFQGLASYVLILVFRVQGLRVLGILWVWGLGFGVEGSGASEGLGLGFTVQG